MDSSSSNSIRKNPQEFKIRICNNCSNASLIGPKNNIIGGSKIHYCRTCPDHSSILCEDCSKIYLYKCCISGCNHEYCHQCISKEDETASKKNDELIHFLFHPDNIGLFLYCNPCYKKLSKDFQIKKIKENTPKKKRKLEEDNRNEENKRENELKPIKKSKSEEIITKNNSNKEELNSPLYLNYKKKEFNFNNNNEIKEHNNELQNQIFNQNNIIEELRNQIETLKKQFNWFSTFYISK